MKLELQEGATTLTSISDCTASSATKVMRHAVDLVTAKRKLYALGALSASKLAGISAVGGSVGTPLRASTEEQCLFACVSYVNTCKIVTTSMSLRSFEKIQWMCWFCVVAIPCGGLETMKLPQELRRSSSCAHSTATDPLRACRQPGIPPIAPSPQHGGHPLWEGSRLLGWVPAGTVPLVQCLPVCSGPSGYKSVKGRNHTAEERTSMHSHRPHVTSQQATARKNEECLPICYDTSLSLATLIPQVGAVHPLWQQQSHLCSCPQ